MEKQQITDYITRREALRRGVVGAAGLALDAHGTGLLAHFSFAAVLPEPTNSEPGSDRYALRMPGSCSPLYTRADVRNR